jgi:hypothetical protein
LFLATWDFDSRLLKNLIAYFVVGAPGTKAQNWPFLSHPPESRTTSDFAPKVHFFTERRLFREPKPWFFD